MRYHPQVGQIAPPALWPGNCEVLKPSSFKIVEILFFIIISLQLVIGKIRAEKVPDAFSGPGGGRAERADRGSMVDVGSEKPAPE